MSRTATRTADSPDRARRRHPTASAGDLSATGAGSLFTPVPDYSRNPAIGTRTCTDCQAAPGEPCHWACSSWWT